MNSSLASLANKNLSLNRIAGLFLRLIFNPSHAIPRLDQLPLPLSYGLHLLSYGWTAFVLLIAIASEDPYGFILQPLDVWHVITYELNTDSVRGVFAICLLGFIAIELAYFPFAALTMCWSARFEGAKDAFWRSLKRWWLMPWSFSLLGGISISLAHILDSYWIMFSPGNLEILLYFLLVGTTTFWSSWLLFGVTSQQINSNIGRLSSWPPRCGECGYEIYDYAKPAVGSAILTESNLQTCPECGTPIHESVSRAWVGSFSPWPVRQSSDTSNIHPLKHLATGTSWDKLCIWCSYQRQQNTNQRKSPVKNHLFRAWYETAKTACFFPRRLGQTIHAYQMNTGYRSHIIWTWGIGCVLAMMYYTFTILTVFMLEGGFMDFNEIVELLGILLMAAIIHASSFLGSGLAFAIIVGSIVSFLVRGMDGRRRFIVARQAAAYTLPITLIWATFVWLTIYGLTLVAFATGGSSTFFDYVFILFGFTMLAILIGYIIHTAYCVTAIVRATRNHYN